MNINRIIEEISQVVREAIKHRVGDFNDHEAHLLMKREIDEALSKYIKTLVDLKKDE